MGLIARVIGSRSWIIAGSVLFTLIVGAVDSPFECPHVCFELNQPLDSSQVEDLR